MEVLHMIGGMPRSGSTLLCNVLAQNPRIQSTCTSGCMDVMFGVRNQWDEQVTTEDDGVHGVPISLFIKMDH